MHSDGRKGCDVNDGGRALCLLAVEFWDCGIAFYFRSAIPIMAELLDY